MPKRALIAAAARLALAVSAGIMAFAPMSAMAAPGPVVGSSPGCAAFGGALVPPNPPTGSATGTGYRKGDVLRFDVTDGSGLFVGLYNPDSAILFFPNSNVSFIYEVPADTDETIELVGGYDPVASAATWSCTPAPIPPAPEPPTEAITSFLETRVDLLLANAPAVDRRIARLSGQRATAEEPGAAIMSFVSSVAQGRPVPVSASLSAIEAMEGNGEPSPFDMWFEGTFALFDNSGPYGRFATAGFGADYLVSPDLLIGGFVSLDRMEQFGGDELSGTGWLAGPYLTARLGEALYFDVLAGAGTAGNTIDTGLGFVDEFGSTRWLVDGSLTGNFASGPWTFAPRLGVRYAEETSEAYTDGLGTAVPSVTVGLGQVSAGPGIVHTSTDDGIMRQLSLRLDAVKSFGDRDDFSARAEAGVDWTLANGLALGATATYSGIGASHQSAGLSMRLSGSF